MLFKKTAPAVLAAFLTAAMTAVSCVNNDRTMGEGLIPGTATITVGTRTFDLPVTNRTIDSVQSSNSSNMLIGTLTDDTFGTMMAHSASYILPYSDSTDFGDTRELIDAYLSLSIDSTYYLDPNQEGIHQRIRIYKLTVPMDSTLQFCNSITPDCYDPEPVTVSDPVIYGNGSIRVDLTDSFASELLALEKEDFEDLNKFLEKIKGLYVMTEAPIGSASGGRLNYLNLGTSTINLNYRTDVTRNDGTVERIDTTEAFVFGYTTALNNFSTSSSHLESDTPGDILYLEGLTGVKPHISARALKEMIDAWIAEEGLEDEMMVISRAELRFPYEMPTDYERFDKEHPASIYAFTSTPWASDTLRFLTPLDDIYESSTSIGDIDRANMVYSMNVTAYMQKLIMTPAEDIDESMDLWIAPLREYTDSYGTSYYDLDNGNYNKIILNGPSAERHPTLTLTYGKTPLH